LAGDAPALQPKLGDASTNSEERLAKLNWLPILSDHFRDDAAVLPISFMT
jgi:hypothetical protein